MFFVWWTGKGWLTAAILVVIYTAFGIATSQAALDVGEKQVYWGSAAIMSAAAIWVVGRRVNAKSIASVRSTKFHHTIVYRARNRFMSFPLEFWAIPLAIGGLISIGLGLVVHQHAPAP